jgi:hypothetical protein
MKAAVPWQVREANVWSWCGSDTVRRSPRPFSLTVQAYLAHLRDAGFTGAPLSRGFPHLGRVPDDRRQGRMASRRLA